jgi:limonene-1,2-epoxide hydrolase
MEESQHLRGQFGDVVLDGPQADGFMLAGIADDVVIIEAELAGGGKDAAATVAERIDEEIHRDHRGNVEIFGFFQVFCPLRADRKH